MSPVASFAVGSLPQHADPRPLLWGLWDALDHAGYRVQSYHARAAYGPCQAATAITGLCPQHLDSWLMSPETIERLYRRSAAQNDVTILHGALTPLEGRVAGVDRSEPPAEQAGDIAALRTQAPHPVLRATELSRIESIAETLRLPLLAQVDVQALRCCALPERPAHCAGVILDQVADRQAWATWKTILESEWRVPVLGAMTACPELRAAASSPSYGRDVYRRLGKEFRRFTALGELVTALRPKPMARWSEGFPPRSAARPQEPRLRIAFAYDEVFCCGFRGVLDEFEAQGAELLDFSPLHDESLPHEIDLVYLGCAQVERYAEQLLANTCMVAALREHICDGRRIYGEVGGAAYLCREIVLPGGDTLPMLAILPATAILAEQAMTASPREITLRATTWLGEAGGQLRGYHSPRWRFEPLEHSQVAARDAQRQVELLTRHQAIGSALQLFPAANARMLQSFLTPCPAALSWAGTG